MELPTYIALSRLSAQQRGLDVTAANLANANTPGFKASRVLSTDWLSAQTGTSSPQGDRKVAFVQDRATYREQTSGALEHTSNPLDLAIAGDGYFTVNTARGPRLTRAGHFSTTASGTITDLDGNNLLDTTGQPLRIPDTDSNVTVTADGTVSTESGDIGRIGIVNVSDVNRVTPEGALDLRADVPTAPIAQPKIIQGAIEGSNVQPISETTKMMNDVRSFEFTSQFVSSESERMQSAIDKITGNRS